MSSQRTIERAVTYLAALAVATSLLVVPAEAQEPAAAPRSTDHAAISSVHRDAVDALVRAGVVAGCGDGAFCPGAPVTREQMASFLGRALGLSPDPSPRFRDIAPTSTHGGFVGALAEAGITDGCALEDHYCPGERVTREQMATFISRAYALTGNGAPRFDDVGDGVHRAGIAGVAAARITTGCTDTAFCPRDVVTREQMASFIARSMGLSRDARGCPATDGPASITDLGTAAAGFPVNSAERVGDRLYIFSLGVSPSRIVTYDLASQRVVRTREVPTGDRTWAVHSPEGSPMIYFGQDARRKTLYRYDTRNDQLLELGAIPGVTEVWDITSDDQGRLYIGTSARDGTIWRYDPGAAPALRLRPLTFRDHAGRNVGGQVTQVEWSDGVLYLGTGRGSARLFAIDTDGWQPGTSATAHRLPGVSGFGVYSLAVGGGLVVAGLENWEQDPTATPNAGLAILEPPTVPDPADPEPTEPEDGDPEPTDPGDPEPTDPGDPEPTDPGDPEPTEPGDPEQTDPGDDEVTEPGDDESGGGELTPTTVGALPSAEELASTLTVRGGAPLAPGLEEGAFTAVAIDDDPDRGATVYATGRSEGTVFEVAPGSTELVDLFDPYPPPAPVSPTRQLFVHDGRLLGVAAPAMVWRSALRTGSYTTRNLVTAGAPSAPVRPQSLAAGNGRIAVGNNNSLTIHRPSQGSATQPISGEPKVMRTIDDRLYLGLYPSGTLREVALTGTYPAATVGTWNDDDHGRPTDLHHDAATGRLQLSAQETQNSGGRGALVSFVATPDGFAAPSWYAQPDGERGASAVTTWGSRTLLAGTGTDARVASRPTSATSPASTRWTTVPVPGGGDITSLVTVAGQVHGMTEGGIWFTLLPSTGRVTQTRRVFDGNAGHLVAHGHWLYAVTRDCLVAIDTRRNRVETLHGDLGATTFGTHTVAISPGSPAGSADAYVIRGTDLVRLRHAQR